MLARIFWVSLAMKLQERVWNYLSSPSAGYCEVNSPILVGYNAIRLFPMCFTNHNIEGVNSILLLFFVVSKEWQYWWFLHSTVIEICLQWGAEMLLIGADDCYVHKLILLKLLFICVEWRWFLMIVSHTSAKMTLTFVNCHCKTNN